MSERIDTPGMQASVQALARPHRGAAPREAASRAAASPGRLGFRGLLVGAFALMLAAFVAATAFTWHELSLRRHDYAILHLEIGRAHV